MRTQEFSDQFANEVEPLDYFFHRKIKGARITDDIEALKQDLTQDTALAVLMKLQNENYNDYSIKALIWIKAKDVWRAYLRSLRTQIQVTMPVEEVQPGVLVSDPQSQYEQRNQLDAIRPASGKELQAWQMLILHEGGYPYKEIAEMFHSTESAVKVAVYRFRNQLKRR